MGCFELWEWGAQRVILCVALRSNFSCWFVFITCATDFAKKGIAHGLVVSCTLLYSFCNSSAFYFKKPFQQQHPVFHFQVQSVIPIPGRKKSDIWKVVTSVVQRCQQFQRKQYVIPNSMCYTCIRVFTLAIIRILFVLLSRQLKHKKSLLFSPEWPRILVLNACLVCTKELMLITA